MTEQPHVRLLICLTCKALDEIPDYQGPPEYDRDLEYVASKHRTPSGEEHVGNLVRIPLSVWERTETRDEVVRQIKDGLKGEAAGLGLDFYNLRSTLNEDALSCFAKHGRNPLCSDYKSDKMLLTPGDDVKELWKDVTGRKRPKNLGPKRHLCDHCPVASMVASAMRDKAGY